MSFNVALLIFVSIIISVYADDRDDVKAHKRYVNQNICKEPVPRVVELSEIIPKDLWKDKYEPVKHLFQPPVTVLNRCHATGCCKDANERCKEVESFTEEVTLTFAIFYPKYVDYYKVTARNHTKCACDAADDTDIK